MTVTLRFRSTKTECEHDYARRPWSFVSRVVIVAAHLIVGWAFAAGQTVTSGPVPATLFGMHQNAIQSQPWAGVCCGTSSPQIGAEGKGTAITWGWIQPALTTGCTSSGGDCNWSALDGYVNAAVSNGISIFFSNDSVPRWAVASAYNNPTNCNSNSGNNCDAMVSNLAYWQTFVTAMVLRYKHYNTANPGTVNYELWNEPSLYDFDQGASASTNYADMVTLTNAMQTIIRANDPNALIIAPSGIGVPYLTSIYAAGETTDVDVISFHDYESVAESVVSNISATQSFYSGIGLGSKPLWNTEGSWGTNSLTTAQQVAFVARWYLLHWSNNVSRMYWYQWDNPSWGPLWDSTTGLHAAGAAYREIYNWMVGATMTVPCAIQSGTIWTCTLARPGGYTALVVWDTAGSGTYTPPAQYTDYKDLAGATKTFTGSLAIGIQPLLFESTTPSPPSKLTAVAH